MKGIAFVPIGAAPGAGGGKEGIGQGNEMNDGRPNNGCFGNNKGEGNHSGNKIQDQTMGDQPAPEGFSQGQLPEPKLPQRYGRIHWTLTSSIFVFSSQFKSYLADFVNAYKFGHRLKTLKSLTPYEHICKA
jgi:hypothetical protein